VPARTATWQAASVESTSITALGAADLSEAIHHRDVSSREVMTAYLDRIAQVNPAVNAIVSLRQREVLMAEAATRDEELVRGVDRGWLHGVPQAVKDLAAAKGLPMTMGSRLLEHFVPDFDCLVVERMKAAGCIVIGKTNVPEFGLGSHTFNEVFGATRNAFDPARTAGGSSGGAAVALAKQMLPVADGSDYMGSLRNPAAWNDIFGFRPSQGRVPNPPDRDSYVAQMATEGPMARSVLDLALLLGTQAGYHPAAPLSLPGRLDEFATVDAARHTLSSGAAGARIAWLGDLDGHLAMEPGILDRCLDGLRRLEHAGCKVESACFDMSPDRVWAAWLVWRHVLVGANLSALVTDEERRTLVKPEALWELDQSRGVSAAQLTQASAERTAFYLSVVALFDRFDALAIPSAQVWPFPIEQRWPERIGDREMDTYHRWMEVTAYATFAGLPSISVPVGRDERGLPMGMQLIGAPRGDVDVLRLAHLYEQTLER
jgi:amidase